MPSLKKNKPRLLINGHDQINLLSDWFVDDKGRKLEHYLKNVSRPTMKRQNTLMPSAAVKNISMERRSLPVYSVEVADTHTFAVSQGIYVHNCIPIDPFYLTWKAREYEVCNEVHRAGWGNQHEHAQLRCPEADVRTERQRDMSERLKNTGPRGRV